MPITPIKIFLPRKLSSFIECNPEMIVSCLSLSAVFTVSLKTQCAGGYKPDKSQKEGTQLCIRCKFRITKILQNQQ